ncbi:23S rRNA (adenine(2030)-N(6))-methyltransferase RlmJ [Montanilutibacter psychrotolerans]|uniref:Ribosomal RNA large subunit methyltransferase J n=1 Tax=Montanilutibacter psychrotolerans TaxID=1327343 RepID=A0A3M8SY93_9GAMM|nr:23S rRNA (adenine(2030)-N(6))-methyltransferase RlmJ [Lysobacter psychrotolerans]RNF86378.1 23S rRNA (adenine(2030)-N(6))-methyltransferase RlmJ [Lysobacter psychrotolerans]
MNYRHAFHAGNHADVLKHVTVLAICDALTAKPAPVFALDTHAGRGLYALDGNSAQRTGEAEGGIGRLLAEAPADPLIGRYLQAVRACRAEHGKASYPGSPWLLAHALREQDRIAACELQPEEATQLKANFVGDERVAVHARDGYAGIKALLPPKIGDTKFARGLVLIDPPYEAQLEEFDAVIAGLREALGRWPQACYALWYPIKLRRSLQPFFRRAATLPVKSSLLAELLVRADDSPLRMNGSGMLLLNPPFQIEQKLQPALNALAKVLGEGPGASARLEWLKTAQ